MRSRVLAFNPELVAEDDLPASYKDLVDPEWSGRIGVAPTNGSFVAFVSAMILTEGEEATLEWLQGLAANDPVTFDGNAPIAAAVDAGDVDVGLINHYYLAATRRRARRGHRPEPLLRSARCRLAGDAIGDLDACHRPESGRRQSS